MRPFFRFLIAVSIVFPTISSTSQTIDLSEEVESKAVNIYSDGTRLSGNIFYPKGSPAGGKFPAILLCHG